MRILLIQNDLPARVALENTLAKAARPGFTPALKAADNLETAIEILEREVPDIILLDLHLPNVPGLQAFETLRQLASDIPIILLSAQEGGALVEEALLRGAEDFLSQKTLTPDLLVRVLYYAFERNKLRVELDGAYRRLEKLALMDGPTEVFNRRGLQEILSHEIHRAKRKQSSFLVLLIDLDDFNRINHALGHNVGDIVLREVAHKLKTTVRATDYVGRVASDEFMILLPETRLAEGMRVAEKVRLAVSTTMIALSTTQDIKVTASLGLLNVGLIDAGNLDPTIDELISRARIALRKSKESGKNQIHELGFDDVFTHPLQEGLQISGNFRAFMQPIYRLNDQTQAGCEFLTRCVVPGLEMPDDFFRASLDRNILTLVDHQCLKACIEASSFLAPNARCHVNLFPSTLIGIPVETLLEIFPSEPSRITYCIEISEQQIIGDPSYLGETVDALKRAGIQIALDDLGFGRSCLESLILLEPQIVKIDKRCVMGIARNRAHARSLKRLLKMAKSLGAEVVAEGIESREDLQVLKHLGVKYGQGYLFGKPVAVPPSPDKIQSVS